MLAKEKKVLFLDEEQSISFGEELGNWAKIKLFCLFETDKFLEYQKELIQDFIIDLKEKINSEWLSIDKIKSEFEISLQTLNSKLKIFADKVRDVDYFKIKWFCQIITEQVLMSSMIGDVTVMIFRDSKLYYSLHNAVNTRWKIDLFSDFVEWDVENHDEVIYAGTKVADVIDNNDIKDIEDAISSTEVSLLKFIQEILLSRIDKANLGFMFLYTITGGYVAKIKENKKYKMIKDAYDKFWIEHLKEKIFKDKYQVTVIILSVFIVFMLVNLLSQFIRSSGDKITTSDGISINVTLEDIKKDIFLFQWLDSSSEEKSMKYHELMEKINMLQSKWKRPDDITQLKKLLQAEYYKWFNISYINSLDKFDDPTWEKKSKLVTLNSSEINKLWTLKSISYRKDINIAGTKSSLIWVANDTNRWSLVEYNLSDDELKWCNGNLLKDGFYCWTKNSQILSVNRGGSQTVTTSDPDWFPANIAWLAVYGKSNLYVFQSNVSPIGNSRLAIRYRNTLWSQIIYQWWQKYLLNTGASFSNLSSFAVDSSFLTWNNWKLFQFWRDPATSFNLANREIKLLWWDKITTKYSNDVKIISSLESKYVFFFDRVNQTFTVYESRPAKNWNQFATNYSLYYVFRFQFDLGTSKVVDVEVPDSTWNRPEMYILWNNAVYKVALYEFIDSIKQNNTIKQLSN